MSDINEREEVASALEIIKQALLDGGPRGTDPVARLSSDERVLACQALGLNRATEVHQNLAAIIEALKKPTAAQVDRKAKELEWKSQAVIEADAIKAKLRAAGLPLNGSYYKSRGADGPHSARVRVEHPRYYGCRAEIRVSVYGAHVVPFLCDLLKDDDYIYSRELHAVDADSHEATVVIVGKKQ